MAASGGSTKKMQHEAEPTSPPRSSEMEPSAALPMPPMMPMTIQSTMTPAKTRPPSMRAASARSPHSA
jgi:hypothetical protein